MSQDVLESHVNSEYKWGFSSDVDAETFPKGLNESVVRALSAKKQEPLWLLEYRLKAYRQWLNMSPPHHWANFKYPQNRFSKHQLLFSTKKIYPV